MSLLQILLCVCAGLLALTFLFLFVATIRADKKAAKAEKAVAAEETDTASEEQLAKDKAEEVKAAEPEASTADVAAGTLVIGDIEDGEQKEKPVKKVKKEEKETVKVAKEKKVPVSFPEKLLALDISILDYYDSVNNKFIGYKKVHARISATGISYRFGKDLISKLSIKDDVLRIHFALPISKYRFAKFKKEDLSDVRAYKEVPLTLNLTTVDELKSALSLIEDLEKNLGLERKNRFLEVDSVAELKEIVNSEKAE